MNSKLSILAIISLGALIGLSPVTAWSDDEPSYKKDDNSYGDHHGKDWKKKKKDDGRKRRHEKVKVCHVFKKRCIDFKRHKLPYKICFGRVVKVDEDKLRWYFHKYPYDRLCKPDHGKKGYSKGKGYFAQCGSKDGYDGYHDLSRDKRMHYSQVYKKRLHGANCYFKVKHKRHHKGKKW